MITICVIRACFPHTREWVCGALVASPRCNPEAQGSTPPMGRGVFFFCWTDKLTLWVPHDDLVGYKFSSRRAHPMSSWWVSCELKISSVWAHRLHWDNGWQQKTRVFCKLQFFLIHWNQQHKYKYIAYIIKLNWVCNKFCLFEIFFFPKYSF